MITSVRPPVSAGVISRLIVRLLRTFRAVFGASLATVLYSGGIKGPTNYVVLDAGKVFHPATPDEHNRVLLQVVTLTRDVGRDLDPVGETNTRDLPEGRVRLLWRGRVYARAHSTTLRAATKSGRLRLLYLVRTSLPY